jgi:hypothetical protein
MGLMDKLKERVENIKSALKGTSTPLDLKQFNDPLAEEIEWTPAKSGGTNVCTHRLHIGFDNTALFKATLSIYLFTGIFIVMGVFAILAPFIGMLSSGKLETNFLIPVIIGIVFCSIGIFMNRLFTAPVTFDLDSGYFWKGRINPNNVFDIESRAKEYALIKDIHALQILSEYCSGGKNSSYYSYELNLVLKDGARKNVVDHGNIKKLREDAEKLADFLNVPVWDIT